MFIRIFMEQADQVLVRDVQMSIRLAIFFGGALILMSACVVALSQRFARAG